MTGMTLRSDIASEKIFKRKRFSGTYVSSSSSFAPNTAEGISGTELSYTIPEGYTPIGLIGFSTGSKYLGVANFNINNTGSSNTIVVRNHSANTLSNLTAEIEILFVKSEYVAEVEDAGA